MVTMFGELDIIATLDGGKVEMMQLMTPVVQPRGRKGRVKAAMHLVNATGPPRMGSARTLECMRLSRLALAWG